MADTAVKVRAIALTALQETLRRKVLYVAVVLMILLIASIVSAMSFLRMAVSAGETETVISVSNGFVQTILQTWNLGGVCLAIFLGAIGISSEVSARTIVNVLSRPVERWTYLAGRWAGVFFFLSCFQIAGIVLAFIVAFIFDVRFTPILWLGLAKMFVDVLFFSGVSLGLSALLPPVLAGAGSVLISVLPEMVERATHHPKWIYSVPAGAAYYLTPAVMPTDLISDSFAKQLLNPEYGLYARVLVENLLYASVVFAVACLIFSRREIRFR